MAREKTLASTIEVHPAKAQFSPSILWQLTFHHMLVVIRVTAHLKDLLPAMAQPAPVLPPRRDTSNKQMIHDLLAELISPFDDRLVDHPWSPPLGALSKVRRDMSRLSTELSQSEEVFAWWETIEETWRAAVVAQESQSYAPIMKLVKLIDRATVQMFSVLELFPTDENVLLCVLRQRAALDESLGSGYTVSVLQRLHKHGVDGIKSLITKSYRKRGFQDLLPVITQSITELSGQVV